MTCPNAASSKGAEMSETTNAKIVSTALGVEDHGIFTAMIHLDYGGRGQGFGGYSLDAPPVDRDGGRVPTKFGMAFIAAILKTLEVETWEKLPGTYCRVKADRGCVREIGHLLKDKWFDPKALAQEYENES